MTTYADVHAALDVATATALAGYSVIYGNQAIPTLSAGQSAYVKQNVLFLSGSQKLKNRIRLGGAPDTDEFRAQLDSAIVEARVEIYDRLGEARVAQLLATTGTDSPVTLAERDRAKAEILETKLVKKILLAVLPTAFIDSSGDARQVWNEQAILRSPESRARDLASDLSEEIDRLFFELEQGALGSDDLGHVLSIEPETLPVPKPYDSIKRNSVW